MKDFTRSNSWRKSFAFYCGPTQLVKTLGNAAVLKFLRKSFATHCDPIQQEKLVCTIASRGYLIHTQ